MIFKKITSDSTSQKQHYKKVIHKTPCYRKVNSPHIMATGNKCHVGPCGPCYLCGIHASRYTHIETFSSELHQGTQTQRDSVVSYKPSCISQRSRKLCISVMCVIYKCNTTFITPHSHHAGRLSLAKQELDVVLNVVRRQQ